MKIDEKSTPATGAVARSSLDRRLLFIFFTVFMNIVGVGMIIPLIPFYASQYGASSFQIGLLTTTLFFALQFLVSPTFGALSDRWGRRPIILIGIVGELAGYVIMGFATNLSMLYLSRVIAGAMAGNSAATNAYIADVTPFKERTRAYSFLGGAFAAGLFLGPAIGALLARINPLQGPVFGAAALLGVNFLLGLFLLPESLAPELRSQQRISRQLNPFAVFGPLLARPALRGPLLATLLFNIALTGFQANFSLFSSVKFGIGPAAVEAFFGASGLASLVVQAVLIPVLTTRLADTTLIMAGTAVFAAGNLAIAYTPTANGFWAAAPLFSGGYSLTRGPLTGLTTKLVKPNEQGWVNGGIQATIGLGSALGGIWAGTVYDSVGHEAPYWTAAIAVAVAGAAILFRARPAASPLPAEAGGTNGVVQAPPAAITLTAPARESPPAATSPMPGAVPAGDGVAVVTAPPRAELPRPILSGSLEGVGLPAVIQFLNGLEKSGSLRLWRDAWSGELCLDRGRLVLASFHSVRGPAALMAIQLVLSQGSFAFLEGVLPTEPNVSLDRNQLVAQLSVMPREVVALASGIRSPQSVPHLVDPAEVPDTHSEVILERGTLQTFMAVNGKRTIEEISDRRGLDQALVDVVKLIELGLIEINGSGP